MRDKSIFRELEKFVLSVMEEKKLPGCSVAVVEGRDVVWSKGFGYADMEKKIPATSDTVYRICSISKPVTTVGFLQLMEKGKFKLDDPLNDHLKVKIRTEFAEQPTIRDLLTHYSGMPTFVPPIFYDTSKALTTEEWIAKIARVVRPPKQVYQYSNPGFDIAGYLIELFTGAPFDVHMIENVFKPLEMNSSAYSLTESLEKRVATGYNREVPGDPLRPVKPYVYGTVPAGCASGGGFSTAVDLAHFIIPQLNGGKYKRRRILKEDTLNEMHKLQVSAGNSRSGIGLIWNRDWHHGHLVIRHTCGMTGWRGHVAFYPELKIGVAWCTNFSDDTGWRPPATTALRIVAGEHKLFDPKTIEVKSVPNEWERIAGTYGTPGRKQYVTIDGGHLIWGEKRDAGVFLEKTEGNRYLIHGGAEDGYEITFEYDKNGRVKQYDLGNSVVYPYLVGSWRVRHTTNPQFYDWILDIESEKSAKATNMDNEKVPVSEFKVEDHRIAGTFKTMPAEDHLGWSTKELKVDFELLHIENQLVGQITTTREGATTRGGGFPVTLSRT